MEERIEWVWAEPNQSPDAHFRPQIRLVGPGGLCRAVRLEVTFFYLVSF